MVKAKFNATVEELEAVIELVNATLVKSGWDALELPIIDIAVEEIYINIASYAYKDKTDVTPFADITIISDEESVEVVFEDCGVQYNPLEKPDPDVTLPAEERSIGGLGIYMVKNSMDRVNYEYRDGRNVFTIYKKREGIV